MRTAALGLGTYRIRPSVLNEAVVRAATSPADAWIDTAPNYLDGRAQSLLAPALARHPIPVSTKVGFLTAQATKDALSDRALTLEDAERGHCLSTPYVHWQCALNRTELGRDRLDLVFAHNPEHSASDPYEALRAAFTALEAEAAVGTLTAYGVATWDGFDTGTLAIPALHQLASEAAGDGTPPPESHPTARIPGHRNRVHPSSGRGGPHRSGGGTRMAGVRLSASVRRRAAAPGHPRTLRTSGPAPHHGPGMPAGGGIMPRSDTDSALRLHPGTLGRSPSRPTKPGHSDPHAAKGAGCTRRHLTSRISSACAEPSLGLRRHWV